MAVASYALCTLAQLKTEIPTITDSSQDTFLESLIDRVSRRFETLTRRKLVARTYKSSGAAAPAENLVLNGEDRITPSRFLFPHPPLNSITSLVIWNRALDDSTTLDISTDTAFEPSTGRVDLIDGDTFTLGFQNIKAEWNSGYTTIPEDLRDAAVVQCVFEFQKRDRARHGLSSTSFEGESVSYLTPDSATVALLPEVYQAVMHYKVSR